MDRFNLTGLNTEVSNYQLALDFVTDNLGMFLWIIRFNDSHWPINKMTTLTRSCDSQLRYQQGCYTDSYTLDGLLLRVGFRKWCSKVSPPQ